MTLKLWLAALKQKRWSILTYCLLAVGFLVMYMSVFPTIQAQAQNFNKLLQSYPKAFMKAFDVNASAFSTLGGYLAVEAYGVIWQILVILLGTSFAGNALAGEVESGTLALTLSMPISRVRVYLARYLAGLTILALFVTSSMFLLIPLAALRHDNISSVAILKLGLNGWLWGVAIYSFGYMISALFEERSHVYQAVGGVVLGMYALNIFSGLLPRLDKSKYVSIFHYYSASTVLVNSRLDSLALVVLTLTSLLTCSVGLILFSRRDISI